MSKETFAGEPLDPHAAADEIERLRGEVERLTQHNADLVRANQHSMDWFNDALARAEAAEAKVAKLREALTPFGDVAEHDIGDNETDADMFRPILCNHAPRLTVGDLRRARTALQETE